MPRIAAKATGRIGKSKAILTRKHKYNKMYPFCHEVLGYEEMAPKPHEELCDWLDNVFEPLTTYDLEYRKSMEQTKALDLLPRGTFKTSVCTVGGILKCLEQNPNLRILIDTHTWKFSMQILSEIKHHLINNEKFRALFGAWDDGAAKWSEDSITIGKRTIAMKEPSIDTSGVDKSKNGGHYDLIIADDLHQEKNSSTEEGRKKVRDHIQNLYPILEVGGVLLVNGTRWHHADAYGWILGRNKEAIKRNQPEPFKTLIKSCFLDDGTLYFPSRLDDVFLAQQKLELDDKKFAVWYLNKPIEDSSKYFPDKYIQFFTGDYSVDRGQPTLDIDIETKIKTDYKSELFIPSGLFGTDTTITERE